MTTFLRNQFIFKKSISNFKLRLSSNRIQSFHTSSPKQANPLVFLILRSLTRLAPIFMRKYMKKWWEKLPDSQKLKVKKVFGNKTTWGLGLSVLVSYYLFHLESTPITNRMRFIGINEDQMKKISQIELENHMLNIEGKVLNPGHPFYARVASIVNRIVSSNQDNERLREQTWTILVIKDNRSNAFVLPSGHIFVYSSLFKFVSNDDQLAFILGHEISHAILNHGAEQVSRSGVIDAILLLLMSVLWTIIPGEGLAFITQWFSEKICAIMLKLPYSRKLELEADEVGLKLISKACYDVRESSQLWKKWDLMIKAKEKKLTEKSNNQSKDDESTEFDLIEVPEIFSTHPGFEKRANKLDNMMPEALELRRSCNCPELMPFKESLDILKLRKKLEN